MAEATMKRLFIFALLAAAASTPASAGVMVATATGDWSNLPQLSQHGYNHLDEKMQAKLFEIAQSNKCPAFVLQQGRLDLHVTFATQYAAHNSLQALLLPKLDCAEAESVLGGTLLEMVQKGDYVPTGHSESGWYQGGLTFSFAGDSARDPGAPAAAGDPNQIVCEKVEKIGTRLGTARVCMSRAQWAERRRLDREEVEKAQQTRCESESMSGAPMSC
jgi:hypothetical protein